MFEIVSGMFKLNFFCLVMDVYFVRFSDVVVRIGVLFFDFGFKFF